MPHGFELHLIRRLAPTPSPQGEGIFWWRTDTVLIQELREPGIESADKTTKLPLYNTAVQIFLRTHWLPCVRGAVSEAD